MTKKCSHCGKEFKTKPSHFERRKFCSRKCFDLDRKESLKGKNNPCWRGGRPKCVDCGKELTHWGHYDGKVSRCRECFLKINKGEYHYNWRGGITPINAKIRNSLEMRLWKKAILARDKKCVWCGSKTELHVDHIKPFAYYPELRFAIDNGRTLCKPCHKTTDTYLSNSIKNKKKL